METSTPPVSNIQKGFMLFSLLTILSFVGMIISAILKSELFATISFVSMIVSLLLTFSLTLYVGLTQKTEKVESKSDLSTSQFGQFIDKKDFVYVAILGISVSVLLLLFTLSTVVEGFAFLNGIVIDLILTACILILLMPLIKGKFIFPQRFRQFFTGQIFLIEGIPARIISAIFIFFLIVLILQ